jgi:riboflavin synthase alpha subunit
MYYYDTDSLRFNKNNNKDKGDTTMNEKKNTPIQEEAEAIARKVVNNVMDKMAKLCVEKSDSPIDLIANTIASEEALEHSTFDVHIIIRPREDGMHIKTSIKGHVSSGHSDDDEV